MQNLKTQERQRKKLLGSDILLRMRIAQISDFHFTHLTWNPFRLMGKRIFGNLNWIFSRQGRFSHEPLELLPSLFKELEVDLVLLGGDFTTTSLEKEFETAKRFIDQITQAWIAIPGNHDHYTYAAHRENRYYRYFSNAKHLGLKEKGIEVHPISQEWTLIALDTARATSPGCSRGLFSERLEKELEQLLASLGSQSILLFNHYPFLSNDDKHRSLERGEALEKLLRLYPNVRLYLHGHTHRNTIANLQPDQLPLILDGGSVAEGNWNLIDLDSKGCKIEAYRWVNKWQPFRKEEIVWTK